MIPDVTDTASLTMNMVFDTMLQSIPKSMRNISCNRLRKTESAADALLRRQAAESYQPGLAESPPESFPLESIHFEPEVQAMQSHDQQMAAELPVSMGSLSLDCPMQSASMHQSDHEDQMAVEAIVMEVEPSAATRQQNPDSDYSESENDSEDGGTKFSGRVRRPDKRIGRQRHRPGQAPRRRSPRSNPPHARHRRRILSDSDSSVSAEDAMDAEQPLLENDAEVEENDSEQSSGDLPDIASRNRAQAAHRGRPKAQL